MGGREGGTGRGEKRGEKDASLSCTHYSSPHYYALPTISSPFLLFSHPIYRFLVVKVSDTVGVVVVLERKSGMKPKMARKPRPTDEVSSPPLSPTSGGTVHKKRRIGMSNYVILIGKDLICD